MMQTSENNVFAVKKRQTKDEKLGTTFNNLRNQGLYSNVNTL